MNVPTLEQALPAIDRAAVGYWFCRVIIRRVSVDSVELSGFGGDPTRCPAVTSALVVYLRARGVDVWQETPAVFASWLARTSPEVSTTDGE